MRAMPSASSRMERGLYAIPEQPSLMRTSPNIATIETRQRMWDMVFPGEPCPEGRPFELGMPRSLDFENHVCADLVNVKRRLPGFLRVETVHRECLEGSTINAIGFGPKNNGTINVWSGLLLGVVYRTAANWAREVFMTCKSTPLSDAIAKIDVSSFLKNTTGSISGNLEEKTHRLSPDKSLVAEYDLQLASAPCKSDIEYAEMHIAVWLETEKSFPGEKRYGTLLDWCDKPHVDCL
ncbi:hypothetical protein BDP55DRAFT_632933 [Colletotrichum godetiae]|uniref:Uncharacterized protein n=1 Tax=Colletotrichum godetiae TaxID=1209918 RepID=A0AAJ0EWQ7_9PEZI|nr:uncharacterized protein BDP55DRAFT_632933 [Colletotrichum godetiae]KAK1674485.1 hypothetical protein BDP55DRAFT_632933 [Colletotrichum godetiae]